MKYILLVLLLTGCGLQTRAQNNAALENAQNFCRCHDGLDSYHWTRFSGDFGSWSVTCKNGKTFNGNGSFILVESDGVCRGK